MTDLKSIEIYAVPDVVNVGAVLLPCNRCKGERWIVYRDPDTRALHDAHCPKCKGRGFKFQRRIDRGWITDKDFPF